MAAIIRFVDGFEAKLLDERGTWECGDAEVKEILELWTEILEYRVTYSPNRVQEIARVVAEQLGADVVHVDSGPTADEDDPPGTIY